MPDYPPHTICQCISNSSNPRVAEEKHHNGDTIHTRPAPHPTNALCTAPSPLEHSALWWQWFEVSTLNIQLWWQQILVTGDGDIQYDSIYFLIFVLYDQVLVSVLLFWTFHGSSVWVFLEISVEAKNAKSSVEALISLELSVLKISRGNKTNILLVFSLNLANCFSVESLTYLAYSPE